MEPGRYLVRGLKVQGPEWVRAFSRWSLRVEFATVHEPGAVSAFFNFGSDRLKQYIGRQSKYFHAWTIANGGPPRKGEQMSPDVFLDNRALSRAQSLHVRLGGTGAVGDGLPPKPKGMHRTTYGKLAKRFLWLEAAMDSAAVARFGFSL